MTKSDSQEPVFHPEKTTIGMLGSGQLGRMFVHAAHELGYRVHVYSPDADSPAGSIADQQTVASYDDQAALQKFAEQIDVATLEFENLPVSSLQFLQQHVAVRPGPEVLETTQHRIREKSALAAAGFPVAAFRKVHSEEGLKACFAGPEASHQYPAIVKTATWGYDGKGQSRIESAEDIESAWAELNCESAIVEEFVDFQCELSVVGVRSGSGQVACYDPILNEHKNHILDVSVSPSGLPDKVNRDAMEIAASILDTLGVVGVMCVEMFLTRDGRLIVNELAPRPHNSGHLTIEAHETSQFEQQVRSCLLYTSPSPRDS